MVKGHQEWNEYMPLFILMTLFLLAGKGSSQYKAKNTLVLSSPRFLAQKNLPAAIEDTGGNELPESLREKAEAVQAQGGLSSLEEKYYGLPELLTRNKEILTEVCESYIITVSFSPDAAISIVCIT